MIANPLDIVNLLAGFLLGLLPVLIPGLIRMVRLTRTIDFLKFRGTFYLYHWSGTQPDLVRQKSLFFGFPWRGRIPVSMPHFDVPAIVFRGYLYTSPAAACYIHLEAPDHEQVTIVLDNPVHPTFRITSGVIASVTLDGQPTAWRALVSRQPLELSVAAELLGSRQLLAAPNLPPSVHLPRDSAAT